MNDLRELTSGREDSEVPPSGFWVHPDEIRRFQSLSWQSMQDLLLETYPGSMLRRREGLHGWDNVRIAIPARSGQPASIAFLKRHRAEGRVAMAGWKEAWAAKHCASMGVPCGEVVAVGLCRHGIPTPDGRAYSSLFLSGLVGEGLNVYDAILSLEENAQQEQRLREILNAAAVTTARMHSAGLFHGDCHFQHFILENRSPDPLQVRLIDLQQLRRIALRKSLYFWLKDMAQLRYSMTRLGIYSQWAEFWYDRYSEHLESQQLILWMNSWRRRLIDVRGDIRLFRAAGLRLGKLRFKEAGEILSHRFRSA